MLGPVLRAAQHLFPKPGADLEVEIHKALDDGGPHFEENFFFAWRAAEILGARAD